MLVSGLLLSLPAGTGEDRVKSLFIGSLPDADYYAREKEVFERYGRRLGSLVLVVPPLNFSRSEIRKILEYADRMNETLPFTVLWSLNGSHDSDYVKTLARELASHKVPSRVYADLPPSQLSPLRKVAEVWVRAGNGWMRLDGPPRGYGEGVWRCDEIYHGLVRLDGDAWWFFYENGRPSGCSREPPPPSACDVHMIVRANFVGMGEGVALITFPGSQPASNCGGSCGSANTLVNGTCGLRPSDVGGLMFASYMMTHTRSDPCPYYSYCGCLGACDTPQLFISDVREVLRDQLPFLPSISSHPPQEPGSRATSTLSSCACPSYRGEGPARLRGERAQRLSRSSQRAVRDEPMGTSWR